MKDTLSRKQIDTALFSIAIIFILTSILVMFKNLGIGCILFMLTLYYINRIRRWHNQSDEKSSSDANLKKVAQQNSNRGRTIYVQIVDDHGYDLPEEVVNQKLYVARRNAEPRDKIITVRHKVGLE